MQTYTICTQLHNKHNQDIIDYFESSVSLYNKAKRYVFYLYKRCIVMKIYFDEKQVNRYIRKKYHITKRTAHSIIVDAKGVYNTIYQLKESELEKITLRLNEIDERLNHDEYYHVKSIQTDLMNQLKTGNIKCCFGTKQFLKEDIKKFKQQRDKQMLFVGGKGESACNLQFQLRYMKRKNQFEIKVRKDFSQDENDKYVYGQCYFNYRKKELINILRTHSSPITYRIIRKKKRYYLQCIFHVEYPRITNTLNGVIGLDFNRGFIAYAETNQNGDLIDLKKYTYRYGSGNKTKNDLYEIANTIAKEARFKKKHVIIEALDFKRYKEINHDTLNKDFKWFAYDLYMKIFVDVCTRYGVECKKVDPYLTSQIAKKKYCDCMKLSIHQGAAFVIARRGQGFKE